MEVEILNDDSEARNFSDEIREFRRRIVMQMNGNVTFRIKSHLDDMVSKAVRKNNFLNSSTLPIEIFKNVIH